MPLEGIKEYLAPLLDLDEMATDEALVAHLLLESSRTSGQSNSIPTASGSLHLEMCLRSSAVFERFDEEKKQGHRLTPINAPLRQGTQARCLQAGE